MNKFTIEFSKVTQYDNFFNKAVAIVEDKVLKNHKKRSIYFFSTEAWKEGEAMEDFNINDYELEHREVVVDVDGTPTPMTLTHLGNRKA